MGQPQKECTKYMIYHFTAEEKAQLSADLVRNTQDLETLNDRKKQVVADFAAKIKASEAEIFKAARLLGNGYEYRDVPCFAVFDVPRTGMKQIVRKDTGEVVAEEAMSQEEMQYTLNLDLEAAKEEVKHDSPAGETKPPADETTAPEAETEPAADEPEGEPELPAEEEPDIPLADPVRISGSGEGWNASIVVLTTTAGFNVEASVTVRKDDPAPIEVPGVFLSESEARHEAALLIWKWCRAADNKPGAIRRIYRSVMAWAQEQMVASGGKPEAEC